MITVLSMQAAQERHREFDAVITIENADSNLWMLRLDDGRPQLVLAFNDIDFGDGSGLVATRWQVRQAIEFGRMALQECRSLLIHCHAGRCRSPAIALAILADLLGPGKEEQAVDEMLYMAPKAAPNLLVLKHADEILGLRGKLQAAWLDRFEHGEEIERLRRLKQEIHERKQRRAK
jgi:predicted protein tyrosine phosphatase